MNLFLLLQNQIGLIVFTLDVSGRFTSLNSAAEHLFQAAGDVLVGLPLSATLPSERGADGEDLLRRTLVEGQVQDAALEHARPGGARVTVDYTTCALRDDLGQVIGIGAVGRQRADQLPPAAPADPFKQILDLWSSNAVCSFLKSPHVPSNLPWGSPDFYEQLQDGFAFIEAGGRYIYCNSAFRRILSLNCGEVQDDHALETLKEYPDIYQVLTQAQAGSYVHTTCRVNSHGHGPVYLEIGAVPAAADEPGTHIALIVRDVTERKQLEDVSARNAEVLSQFVKYAPAAIAMFDRDMRYLAYSSRYLVDYNLKHTDLSGRSHYEVFPEITERWKEIHRRCQAGAVETCEEDPFPRADGSLDWVKWEIRPWYETDGAIGGVLLFSEVITQRKENADALKKSEERFHTLAEMVPVGVYYWDLENKCQYANQKWLETAGLSSQEAMGNGWTVALHPDDRDAVLSAWDEMVRLGKQWAMDFRFMTPDGKVTWVYGLASELHGAKGQVTGYIGANIDITEHKKMAEELQASLVEKEILLREVHHRVKNNLAAILGLLDIERMDSTDPAAHTMLLELANRVKSMASIHEQLYRSDQLSKIDFQYYLESFVSHLTITFQMTGRVATSIQAQGVELDLDTAVPCGLIVNELVTNALKYAFPGGKTGRLPARPCLITVTMAARGGQYVLSVRDNGIGLPDHLDWRSSKTLGLRLVQMLGEHQLHGRVSVDRSEGTQFTLEFSAIR